MHRDIIANLPDGDYPVSEHIDAWIGRFGIPIVVPHHHVQAGPEARAYLPLKRRMSMNLRKEAERLVSLSTIFVWLGWIGVAWALIAGLLWWIDLATKDAFNFIEAFALSAAAIGAPLFMAIVLASVGHALRLFAMYVSSQSDG